MSPRQQFDENCALTTAMWSCMQFAVGSLLALSMWTLNLHEKPKIDKDLVHLSPHLALRCSETC